MIDHIILLISLRLSYPKVGLFSVHNSTEAVGECPNVSALSVFLYVKQYVSLLVYFVSFDVFNKSSIDL